MVAMLCPVLISRDAELHALDAALERARRGEGGVLMLAGDAGVGKSRLATELASQAIAQGIDVLRGRATESVVPVPFRPITEALMKVARTGVTPDAPEMASYRPALGSLVPEWSRPEDGEAEISPLILGEALIRLLTPPGSNGSVLILEDVHWADPETLAILEYLADNLAGTRVLCVATLRDSEPSAGLDCVRALNARRAVALVEVRRLMDWAVKEMAAACLGTHDVPAAVADLLADCDGLPFAVEEILAAAVSSGQLLNGPDGWEVNDRISTSVPDSIVGSVRHRLGELGPLAGDLLASAAVLGRQFDWTLLPGMAGAAETDVLAELQRAQHVQLIEPVIPSNHLFRFRHSLTRHAILSGLLPPDLVYRSASAAAAVERAHPELPGSWCELAAELHEAAGERVRAAELLLRVGQRALGKGALSTAAASLRDARELISSAPGHLTSPPRSGSITSSPSTNTAVSADPMLAIEIDEALVQALALAGDHTGLAPVADKLIGMLSRAGIDPRREALIRVKAAQTMSEDNPAEAAAHLAAARAITDEIADAALSSQVDAAAAHCAVDVGDIDKARELAHRSLRQAEAAGLDGWAADVAFDSLQVIGRTERARDMEAARAAFERALQIASREEFAVRRIAALHELGTADMLKDGATERLSEAWELANKAGAISTMTVIELQLANGWSMSEDLERAIETARRCRQRASRSGARRIEASALSVLAFIHGVRGERRQAERAAEEAEQLLPGDPELLLTTWGQGRVAASLFLDDQARALQESMKGMSYAFQAPLRAPRRAWGFHALLQATGGGDGGLALRQAREAAPAAGWNHGLLAYAEAVLEGRAGDIGRANALAEEGAQHLRPFAAWWNHLARRLIAPSALADGWGQPLSWLREATAEFEMSGHTRLASACRGLLRQAGERVPRAGRGNAQVPPQMRRLGITSREMDVFLLVARGFSNTEIAEKLYISPKTVETHIASLVAKTGQTGRRELVAHAARFVPS
jgi:DNA-binding CsgD family transcriptional regulator/tetratricopeptide (TPR) repeat protein